MTFEKNNWKSGDVISSTKLNEMEDGIVEASEPMAWGEIKGKPETFTPSTHSHAWEDVTGKPETFTPTIGKTATTAKAGDYVPTWAEIKGKPETFTPETHTHSEYVTADEVADLVPDVEVSDQLDSKADVNHTHEIDDVNGLQASLDGKAGIAHTHTIANVTGLQAKLDDLEGYFDTYDTVIDETKDSLDSLAQRVSALEKLVEKQTDPVEDNGSEEEPKGATE